MKRFVVLMVMFSFTMGVLAPCAAIAADPDYWEVNDAGVDIGGGNPDLDDPFTDVEDFQRQSVWGFAMWLIEMILHGQLQGMFWIS